MIVTDHVDLEVGGGKFSCAKIETNMNQTFYISRGEGREIVRMELGAVNVDLISSEEWNINKSRKLKSKELGVTIDLPGAMLHTPVITNEDIPLLTSDSGMTVSSGYIYKIHMFASDFAGTDGVLEIQKNDRLDKVSSEIKLSAEAIEFGRKIDGVDAIFTKSKKTKIGGTTHFYQVYSSNGELSLSFRLNYAKRDEDRAMVRVKEILKGFRWKD